MQPDIRIHLNPNLGAKNRIIIARNYEKRIKAVR